MITSLHLRQYRSYDDYAIELSPNVNIVVGPNASGKTNLLESVLLICGAMPYRSSAGDVIKHGQTWANIQAGLGDISRTMHIEETNGLVQKKYKINDVTRVRLRFEDILPVILFEPENMRLMTGSPDMRRDFLDDILSLIDPLYSNTKKQYLRVLAQRNRLLKSPGSTLKNQIFIWNIRLSELAGYIVGARVKLLNELNDDIGDIYSEIAGHKTAIALNYQSSIDIESYESSLLKALEDKLSLDIERGFTGYGPHRDDFIVSLKGSLAKTTASRGETRTLVLSLKLLEVGLVTKKRGTKPLVLLDDVFSELDGYRRKSLTTYLSDTQTIITTTDADIIAKEFAQHTNTIILG